MRGAVMDWLALRCRPQLLLQVRYPWRDDRFNPEFSEPCNRERNIAEEKYRVRGDWITPAIETVEVSVLNKYTVWARLPSFIFPLASSLSNSFIAH